MPMQVNITTQVNSKQIRRFEYNGREHIALPSYTLPAGVVMNGGLYTAEEIDANYQGLEGTFAPLGHPQVNGQFVSARSPEGINVGHVGAFNRNVKKAGNRIYMEKWVDVEFAKNSEGGRELLERVEAIERGDDVPPIHTSVAAFIDQLEPNELQKQSGAEWVAKIHEFDHDAILLHEIGAATPEQGVGLFVNADRAQPAEMEKSNVLEGSFNELNMLAWKAVRDKFENGEDDYAYVIDMNQTHLVIRQKDQEDTLYAYTVESGKITIADTGEPVQKRESWVKIAANKVKEFFNPQARPVVNQEEGSEMPMTPEEKAEIAAEVAKAIAANTAEQFKTVTDAVAELKANQAALAESLTANARQEEKEMREAVAKEFGEIVANQLQGEALKAMHAKIGTAATLAGNSATQDKAFTAPDPATYLKN